MLPSRTAVESMFQFEQRSEGDSEFTGDTGRSAARIAYYLKKRMLVGDFKAAVYDAKGNLIENLSTSRRKGINVVDWSMRMKPPKTPPGNQVFPDPNSIFGPYLPEGTYTVKVTHGTETATAEIHVVADPRGKHSAADRAEQFKAVVDAYHLVEHIAYVVDAAKDLSAQAADRAGKLGPDDPLRKTLQSLRDSISATQQKLAASHEGGYSGEIELREKILEVYGGINGYAGKPTESQVAQLAALHKELDGVDGDFHSYSEKAMASANPELDKKKLPTLKLLNEEEWRKKAEEKGGGGMSLEGDLANELSQVFNFLHVR